MERPRLNPSTVFDEEEVGSRKGGTGRGGLRRVMGRVWNVAWRVGGWMLTPVVGRGKVREGEEHSPVVRLVRGVVYRLAVVPVLGGMVVGVLVYAGTHPEGVRQSAMGGVDPTALGVYFETVEVVASDRVVSKGWYVPTLDAQRVLEDKDRVLRERHAAVVLVHDQDQGPAQMLPYVKALHEANVITLTVAVRGMGTERSRGRTFGLREWRDVQAAVGHLRGRATVHSDRIGVIGVGTGGTAALLAAKGDAGIRAVAAVEPPENADELLKGLSVNHALLKFLNPMTRLAFEAAYEADASDGELVRLTSALRDRDVLYLLRQEGEIRNQGNEVRAAVHFLRSSLGDLRPVALGER